MRTNRLLALGVGVGMLLAAGCKQAPAKVNTAPFQTALNAYYQSHPSCAFPAPVTFPVTISPGGQQPDPADLQRFAALADAGLLAKTSKKEWVAAQGSHHIRVHETVDVYNLTDQGKAAWTTQGSGGNFCFGAPHVTAINHYTPEPNNTRYGVSYNYTIGSLPSWTENAKVKAAFPSLAADEASGQSLTGLATLTKTDSGWKASNVASITPLPVPQGSSSSGSGSGKGRSRGASQ